MPSDDAESLTARLLLLRPLIERLGASATLELIADADHTFHVPARTGRSDEEGFSGMLERLV